MIIKSKTAFYFFIAFVIVAVTLGIILFLSLKPKKVVEVAVKSNFVSSCSKIIDLKKELKLNESIFILNFYDNNILEKNYQADADRKLIKAQLDLKYFVEIWPQEFIDYISTTNNAADIKVIDEIKTFDKDTIKIPNSFLTFAVMKSFVVKMNNNADVYSERLDTEINNLPNGIHGRDG